LSFRPAAAYFQIFKERIKSGRFTETKLRNWIRRGDAERGAKKMKLSRHKMNVLLSTVLMIVSYCNNPPQPEQPNVNGVWKNVVQIEGITYSRPDTFDYSAKPWLFLIIDSTKIIHKYAKNCYNEIWTFSYAQNGTTLYKTLGTSPCRIEYTVHFNRDTLFFATDDIIQKFVPCDSTTEARWNNPNWYADMQTFELSLCALNGRLGDWTSPPNELALYNTELSAHGFIADSVDFVASNKIICDTNSFFYLCPIFSNDKPIDSFFWYFNGVVQSNNMYPSIFYKSKGPVDVQLCVKYQTGERACLTKSAYLKVL
jgi:hypothetical protein